MSAREYLLTLGLPAEFADAMVAAADVAADEEVGTAEIANLAVTTGKLAAEAVTTAKIADLNVTTGKIALLAVDTGQLAAGAVETAKIEDLNVTTGKLALLAVGSAQLAASAVTAAKAKASVSAETTGTGSSQNVAHGLATTPSLVLIAVTEDPAGAGFDVAEGGHGSTNVVVTVTNGVKFKVFAWA